MAGPAAQTERRIILYSLIAGVGLIVAIGASILLFSQPPGISQLAYFLLLLLCALASAVVLFGILKSSAIARGDVMGLPMEFGGPAALAIAIVLIGTRYLPPPFIPSPTVDFTIRLNGSDLEKADFDDAVVKIIYGRRSEVRPVDPTGEANVVGAPASVTEKPFQIQLASARLELVPAESGFLVTDGLVQISVRKRPDQSKKGIDLGERIVLGDGFSAFQSSAYDFGARRIVSWGDLNGDIGVALAGTMSFFLPYDEPPFPSSDQANGGIALAPQQNLKTVDDCTAELDYKHHWFVPELHKVYCVRRRAGTSYAKLSVEDLRAPLIAFDWIKPSE